MNSGLEIAGSPILKVVAMLALLALPLPAQKFKVIQNFDGANGMNPESAVLLQGLDGNLYGTTGYGGQGDAGVVFKMTPSGAITVLYSFCPNSQNCTDGAGPTRAWCSEPTEIFTGPPSQAAPRTLAPCSESHPRVS